MQPFPAIFPITVDVYKTISRFFLKKMMHLYSVRLARYTKDRVQLDTVEVYGRVNL